MEQSYVSSDMSSAEFCLKRVLTSISGHRGADVQNLPAYCQALQNTLEQLDASLVAYNASGDQDRRLFHIGQQVLLVATSFSHMEGEYTLSTL
jgi:hypothetical protein